MAMRRVVHSFPSLVRTIQKLYIPTNANYDTFTPYDSKPTCKIVASHAQLVPSHVLHIALSTYLSPVPYGTGGHDASTGTGSITDS